MFKNLKIWVKLLISTLVFILPISSLMFFVFSAYNDSIQRAEEQIAGNRILEPIVELVNQLSEHNILTMASFDDAYNETDNDLSKRRDSVSKEIAKNFDRVMLPIINYSSTINKVISKLNEDSEDTISPKFIHSRWKNLLEKVRKSGNVDLASDYEVLFDMLNKLIRFIRDESGLILDPDLDTYYMMDITLLALPKFKIELSDYVNSVSAYMSDPDTEEAGYLKYTRNSLHKEIENIYSSLNTAIIKDEQFYGVNPNLTNIVRPSYFDFKSSFDKLIKFTESLEGNSVSYVSKRELLDNSIPVIESSLVFWTLSNIELNNLLNKRIGYFEHRRLIAFVITGIALSIAIVMVVLISRQIAFHIKVVTEITELIADGKIQDAADEINNPEKIGLFQKYIDDKSYLRDEILKLFRAIRMMTINLSSLLGQVKVSADVVSNSTGNITSSAKEIETIVAEQAALTNQVNSLSNEIAETSDNVMSQASYLDKMSKSTSDFAKDGLDNLNQLKTNMSLLTETSTEISEKLETIKSRATNISSVITTITKVANQTNLVSLNASIEAERAGAYGTGFAVVAREIRRLADQTAIAALEIEEMITEMQVAVGEGTDSIMKYTSQTKTGSEKASILIDNLSELIESANALPEVVHNLVNATASQSKNSKEINSSMKELNNAAKYTRDSIMEFNNATTQLNLAVIGLNNELKKFTIQRR